MKPSRRANLMEAFIHANFPPEVHKQLRDWADSGTEVTAETLHRLGNPDLYKSDTENEA